MSGTSFGGAPVKPDSVSARLLGGVVRIDLPTARDASGSHYRADRRFYVLVNTVGKTTTVVMPRSKLYLEMPFDSVTPRDARSRSIISNIDVSGSTLGNGGIVNSFPTKRYRVVTRYTETPTDPRKRDERKRVHLVEEIWVPDALGDVPDPIQAYVRANPPAESHEELWGKQAEARRKLYGGLPIRTTWLYTHTFDGGRSASRSSTIDVVDLERADLDPAAFRAPDGYGRFDFAAWLNFARQSLKGSPGVTPDSGKARRAP